MFLFLFSFVSRYFQSQALSGTFFLSILFLCMGHTFHFLFMPCDFFLIEKWTLEFDVYNILSLEMRFSPFLGFLIVEGSGISDM